MHRRDSLLRTIGTAATFGILKDGFGLCAENSIRWSSAVAGLEMGVYLDAEPPHEHLLVFLKNVASAPQDLFVLIGDVPRIEIRAKAPGGAESVLADRRVHRPCCGLCGVPLTERLRSGAIWETLFALEDLLYVSARGLEATLAETFSQGVAVRAIFEVTERQLKENKLSLEYPWLGFVASDEIRKR